MGKLTGNTLKYFADHMKSCEKAPGAQKRRLHLVGDSHESAEYMARIVTSAWGAEWYDADSLAKFAVVKFEYVWQRDNAVNEINKEVNAYRNSHQDSVLEEMLGGDNDGNNAPQKDDEDDEKKTDWTTYIIIGLAAVALILLVIPKRKK